MILTVHAVTGAAFGPFTQNYGLIIFLGLVSHYLLDVIPHRDYVIHRIEQRDFKEALRTDAIKVFIDLLIGSLLVIFIVQQKPDYFLPILLGAIFALVPDGLSLIYHIIDKIKPGWLISRILKKHYFFHVMFLQKRRVKKFFGWAIQILILIILWLIIWFGRG